MTVPIAADESSFDDYFRVDILADATDIYYKVEKFFEQDRPGFMITLNWLLGGNTPISQVLDKIRSLGFLDLNGQPKPLVREAIANLVSQYIRSV